MIYRVYCNGVEFGKDYASLDDARTAKLAFARHWPNRRYYVRKI